MRPTSPREIVKQSLMRDISSVCQSYLEDDFSIVGIEGLLGIQFKDEHSLLFSISESRRTNSATEEASPVKLKKRSKPQLTRTGKRYEKDRAPPPSSENVIEVENPSGYEDDNDFVLEDISNRPNILGVVSYLNCPGIKDEVVSDIVNSADNSLSSINEIDSCPPDSSDCYITDEASADRSSAAPSQKPSRMKRSSQSNSYEINPERKRIHLEDPENEFDDRPLEDSSQMIPLSKMDHHASGNSSKVSYLEYLYETGSGSFMCTLCDQVLRNKRNARVHVEFKHLGIGEQCPRCPKLFRTSLELADHIQGCHSGGVRSFQCEVCGKMFKTARTMKQHYSRHADLRYTTCQLCDEVFNTTDDCQSHIEGSHSKCDVCGFFVSNSNHECTGARNKEADGEFPLASSSGKPDFPEESLDPTAFALISQSLIARVNELRGAVDNEEQEGSGDDHPVEELESVLSDRNFQTASPTPSDKSDDSNVLEISGCDYLIVEEINEHSGNIPQILLNHFDPIVERPVEKEQPLNVITIG